MYREAAPRRCPRCRGVAEPSVGGSYCSSNCLGLTDRRLRSPKVSIDIAALQEELSSTLSSAAELAHARASRVIALRGEQHASLDLPSFASLFNESWNFVIESEKICSRMIVGLRGTMISQVGLTVITIMISWACCTYFSTILGKDIPANLPPSTYLTICETCRRRAMERCRSRTICSAHS